VNLLVEYIKYKLKAKGRHGTHSPFVYEFVDKCQAIDFRKEDKKILENLRKNLKSDHRAIEIKDFGVGSKKMGSKRKISRLYKVSSSKGKFSKLFYQLSSYYKPKFILEFGTSLGIGTIHFAKGNPDSHITTIEACTNTASTALDNFKSTNCTNIQLVNSTFNDFLSTAISNQLYDIVFIDGHHDGQATLDYLLKLENVIHNDTWIIIDDIRWSDSMFNAWQQIIHDEKFHVTIDLFRMGIALKRPQQRKEHFTVKL